MLHRKVVNWLSESRNRDSAPFARVAHSAEVSAACVVVTSPSRGMAVLFCVTLEPGAGGIFQMTRDIGDCQRREIICGDCARDLTVCQEHREQLARGLSFFPDFYPRRAKEITSGESHVQFQSPRGFRSVRILSGIPIPGED
jgi:hypothetical protein